MMNNDLTHQPDVELRHVTKRFGDVIAVDDISLKINRGEFFSLLGPSGCGKTTTLRMIAGFAYPDEGQVYIRGRLENDIPAYRRDTNLVFQQLALFPHLDVFDNVAFGLVVKRKLSKAEIAERVRNTLNLVELSGFESRRIQQLSGGQQQRVAIARALINQPSVLLLDEPLGALDLKLRLQMQLELKALQQRVGTTFVYVTHDQGEAITMSDRIAVMNNGRIEQVASSEEIYSRPATKFVATFIGDTNLFDGRVISREGPELMVESRNLSIRVSQNTIQPMEAVHISLRPEKIKLADPASKPEWDNLFDGRVIETTFMGSFLRYEVTLDSGLELVVQAPNDTGQIWHKGDSVKVGWARDGCVLMPAAI